MHNSRGSILIIFSILITVVVVGVVGYRYVSRQSTPTVINTYEFKTYDEIQADPEFLPFPDKEIEKKFIGINNKGQDVIMYTYDNILDKIEGKKAHDVYKALLETNGWNITESRFNECGQSQEGCRNWGYLKAKKDELEVALNSNSFWGLVTVFIVGDQQDVLLDLMKYFPAGLIPEERILRVLAEKELQVDSLYIVTDMSPGEVEVVKSELRTLGWNQDCDFISSGYGIVAGSCSDGNSRIGAFWITDEFSPVQEVYLSIHLTR